MESPKTPKSSSISVQSFQSPKSPQSEANNTPSNFLIEGTIGAGKSTFLERLKNIQQEITVIPEPVDVWTDYKGYNYLNLFYQDTKKYAFPFQQLAVNTAANSYRESQTKYPTANKFFERSVFSPLKIFAREQYNAGVFSDAEYELHTKITNDVANWVNYDIQGIIYIKTSPEVAQERVVKRSRKEDSTIPIEYLRNIHELHEQWLTRETQYPVLTYLNDSSTTVNNFAKVESIIEEWIANPTNMTLDPTKV